MAIGELDLFTIRSHQLIYKLSLRDSAYSIYISTSIGFYLGHLRNDG